LVTIGIGHQQGNSFVVETELPIIKMNFLHSPGSIPSSSGADNEDSTGHFGPKSDLSHLGESASDLLNFSRNVSTEYGWQPSSQDMNFHDSSRSNITSVYSPMKTPRVNRIAPNKRPTNTRPDIASEIGLLPFEGKCSPIAGAPVMYSDAIPNNTRVLTGKPKVHPSHSTSPLKKSPSSRARAPLDQLPLPEVFVYRQSPIRQAQRRNVLEHIPSTAQRKMSSSPSRHALQQNRSADSALAPTSSGASCSTSDTDNKLYLQCNQKFVEIMPGFSLPLVGTQESLAAYQLGIVSEVECSACATELYCIETASVVLCPLCRSFSPNNSTTAREQLGLGLTVELLAEELEELRFGNGNSPRD
jgi:hypothetical protein